MAIPAYMWLKDDKGNTIESNVKVAGREGSAEVLGFRHTIYIPADSDTGVLMGTRKHEPFVVTKTFCSASPILYKACCSGKTLSEVVVKWYRIREIGSEEEYFRHTLSHARVVTVRPIVKNIKDKHNQLLGHLEEIHFRYERIQWSYLDGNINTFDQWTQKI